MRTQPTPFDRLPGLAGTGVRHLYRFAEAPLQRIQSSNDAHWRRGAGTFLACCPTRRLEAWHSDGGPQRAATVLRACVGAVVQLAVSLVDGIIAGYVVGLLLVVGRTEAAREVAAQHFYPLAGFIVVVIIGVELAGMVGFCWLVGPLR